MVGAGGWNQNASTWLHGIHGTSKRTVPYTGAKTDFSTVLYPGSLKDCSQCHLPNTVNYGATAGLTGGALQPSLLWSYGATGTMATTTAAPAVTNPQVTTTVNSGNSPYVTIGTNYGNGFKYTMAGATVASYTPSTGTATTAAIAGAGGVTVPADSASLVSSPISAACFSCHDDFTAKNHMRNNGGVLYQPRGTAAALDNAEGCLACHGQGTIMDPVVIHQQQ
jgi:OmcA/MtrC family decaheme c-type cytochrome